MIQSDLVLFASPVIKGYPSAILKKFLGKTIPLVHPYITMANAKTRHRTRYNKAFYPVGGLLLGKTNGSDAEDIEIIKSIHDLAMLNLKSRNAVALLTDLPICCN